MIISLVSPCATVGAYKLMQGQETFYGTVNFNNGSVSFKRIISRNSAVFGIQEIFQSNSGQNLTLKKSFG